MIDRNNLGPVLQFKFPDANIRGEYLATDRGDGQGPVIDRWDAQSLGVPEPDEATLAHWESEWLIASRQESADRGKYEQATLADAESFVESLTPGERKRLLDRMLARHILQRWQDAKHTKQRGTD